MRAPPRQQDQEFYYDRAPDRFFEEEPYYKEESRNDYKPSTAREVLYFFFLSNWQPSQLSSALLSELSQIANN